MIGRAAALAVVIVGLSGCAADSIHRYRAIVMGTEATVSVAGDEALARDAARAAFARMHAIEDALSDYRPDSEAMRLVRTVGAVHAVSPDLVAVLLAADRMHRASGGAFDVTVGPLTFLWREARASGKPIDAAALEEARSRVGWHLLEIDPIRGTVTVLAEGMRLDFGGIGKGYAAQEALRAMAALGATRAMVAIAGDLALGEPPSGRDGWRVRIDDPHGSGETLSLARCCVSTSGDREQWIEVDGERRSHVLDPHTGLGATTRDQVTVIGPDGAIVDALASAASLLAPAEVPALVASFPGYRLVRLGEPGATGDGDRRDRTRAELER